MLSSFFAGQDAYVDWLTNTTDATSPKIKFECRECEHQYDATSKKIRLYPFDDTTNPGVYEIRTLGLNVAHNSTKASACVPFVHILHSTGPRRYTWL